MALYLKDPDAACDQAIDWRDYLAGRILAASEWRVSPVQSDGVAVSSAAHDDVRSSVRLTGGRPGHVYSVTNRVTLSDGQVDERSLTLRVEER